MRRRTWADRLRMAALPMMTGGCTLLTATPPTVQVEAVQLEGLGLLDQSLAVILCVFNPNDTPLDFRYVSVGVAGTPLAEGASEVAVRLPPRAATLVPFSVTTTLANLGPQLLGLLKAGAVPYRRHGTAQLAGSIALTLPFSRGGRLEASDLGRALLADAAPPGTTNCHPSSASSTTRVTAARPVLDLTGDPWGWVGRLCRPVTAPPRVRPAEDRAPARSSSGT